MKMVFLSFGSRIKALDVEKIPKNKCQRILLMDKVASWLTLRVTLSRKYSSKTAGFENRVIWRTRDIKKWSISRILPASRPLKKRVRTRMEETFDLALLM